MKILVIGNGFDLAHGLPTSYSNFLDFVRACGVYHARHGDVEYGPYYDFCEKYKDTDLFAEIVEHINTDSRLLEYFLAIYENRCVDGKRGWIDFESEISTIIQALDVARKVLIEHEHEGQITLPPDVDSIANEVLLVGENGEGRGNTFPEDFKEGKVDALLDGLNRLTRLLEIYLIYYVDSIEVTKRLPECEGQKYTHILSFNYTDTYHRLYDPKREAKYCFIHGKAKDDSNLTDCNMVLGIDEYLDQWHRDSENCFIWFKKFFQRINKDTETEYEDWCRQIEENAVRFQKANPPQNDLYIYGHSLDVTDKDILSRLIQGKHTTTYIFYYSKADKTKKIENLVKIIGEAELIQRTRGSKRTIHFVETGKVPESVIDKDEAAIKALI